MGAGPLAGKVVIVTGSAGGIGAIAAAGAGQVLTVDGGHAFRV